MKKGVVLLFTLVFIGVIAFLISTSLRLHAQQLAIAKEKTLLLQINYLIKDSQAILTKNSNICVQPQSFSLEFDGELLGVNLTPKIKHLTESDMSDLATDAKRFISLATSNNATSYENLQAAIDQYVKESGDEEFEEKLNSADVMLQKYDNSACMVKIDGTLFGYAIAIHYILKGSDAKEIVYHYAPR